jgi:hypothetical protein
MNQLWYISDIKNIIWSYLRKKPLINCYNCNRVIVWDKKVCNYHSYDIIYYNKTNIIAHECIKCKKTLDCNKIYLKMIYI